MRGGKKSWKGGHGLGGENAKVGEDVNSGRGQGGVANLKAMGSFKN